MEEEANILEIDAEVVEESQVDLSWIPEDIRDEIDAVDIGKLIEIFGGRDKLYEALSQSNEADSNEQQPSEIIVTEEKIIGLEDLTGDQVSEVESGPLEKGLGLLRKAVPKNPIPKTHLEEYSVTDYYRKQSQRRIQRLQKARGK